MTSMSFRELFIRKWLSDDEARLAFPDPSVRKSVAEAAWDSKTSAGEPDAYDLLHSTCCKGVGDIPSVQAVINLLSPGLEDWWTETMGGALDDAVGRLMELEDFMPGSRPDGLAASEAPQRDEELLLLGFLSVLERGAQASLPASLDSLVARSARRVLLDGSRSTGGALNLAQEPLLRSAARDDLRALLAGRITARRTELRDHVLDFLRSQRARRAAVAGDITESFSGGARNLQERLARATNLSGLDTSRWLPQVVDQWAYRWFNIGAFRGARQRGVTDFVAFAVRDSRTTPFCTWVHGRVVSTARIELQLNRHIRLATQGDLEGLARNWPMLPRSIIQGSVSQFRRGFTRVGLPPYHFLCRTRIRPA